MTKNLHDDTLGIEAIHFQYLKTRKNGEDKPLK